MKLNIDIKNKKAGFEADVERIVEKGMEQHDKNWKDKFNTKHNAKKEMLEMKHKQKLEIEERNQKKKNWFQKIEEDRWKTRELELEEERRKEREKKKFLKIKIIVTIILGVIGLTMMILGTVLGNASGDSDSALYGLAAIGLLVIISIEFIWIEFSGEKKRK